VFSLLPGFLVRRGVQCVGRLDADTTGLLLFSDDGAFIHHHTSPRHRVAKLYEARCVEEVSEEQLERLKRGVVLEGDPTPAQALAERVGSSVIRLTLFEGRYHQVKRMVGAVGNRVETLHRLAIGSFALPDALARGHWMLLGDDAVVQTSKANEGLVS
jgi:16S rRNA pseudouridine516 synthase